MFINLAHWCCGFLQVFSLLEALKKSDGYGRAMRKLWMNPWSLCSLLFQTTENYIVSNSSCKISWSTRLAFLWRLAYFQRIQHESIIICQPSKEPTLVPATWCHEAARQLLAASGGWVPLGTVTRVGRRPESWIVDDCAEDFSDLFLFWRINSPGTVLASTRKSQTVVLGHNNW